MIEKNIKPSKSIRCLSCRVLSRKCQFENNNISCTVCIRRNTECIKVYPKNYKNEIVKLTNKVKSHEERITTLEQKVQRLERNETLMKQNIKQLYTILEE